MECHGTAAEGGSKKEAGVGGRCAAVAGYHMWRGCGWVRMTCFSGPSVLVNVTPLPIVSLSDASTGTRFHPFLSCHSSLPSFNNSPLRSSNASHPSKDHTFGPSNPTKTPRSALRWKKQSRPPYRPALPRARGPYCFQLRNPHTLAHIHIDHNARLFQAQECRARGQT